MDPMKKKVKVEAGEIGRDCDTLKGGQEGLSFLDGLNLVERLIERQKESEEITWLVDDCSSNDGGMKREERCPLVHEEHSKLLYEKDMKIAELNRNLSELKIQVYEKDRIVAVYHEKLKVSEQNVAEMMKEAEKQKQKEWEDNQIMEDLKGKLSESEVREGKLRERNIQFSQIIEQLRHKLVAAEAYAIGSLQTMKSMMQKKLESDQIVEELKRKNLAAFQTVEELGQQILAYAEHKKLSDQLVQKMKNKQSETTQYVEELKQSVEGLEIQKFAAYKAAEEFKKKFDDLVAIAEGLSGLLKVKLDDTVNIKNKSSESGSKHGGPSQAETNFSEQEKESTRLHKSGNLTETWCSLKRMPSSVYSKEIIDIVECDDETNTVGASDLPTNLGETEITCEKLLGSSSSKQSDEKDQRDCFEALVRIPKRKRSNLRNKNDDLPNDEEKEEQNLFNLQNRELCQTWRFGADMLKAFEDDDNLCMKAVCVLYRQQVLASESTESSFYHFKTMGGHTLAEYLIDGDPELKLRKSVSEAKQQFPECIDQCRRLASVYHEKLIMLYCSGEDPFFGSK